MLGSVCVPKGSKGGSGVRGAGAAEVEIPSFDSRSGTAESGPMIELHDWVLCLSGGWLLLSRLPTSGSVGCSDQSNYRVSL